jgi:hypothetical protein
MRNHRNLPLHCEFLTVDELTPNNKPNGEEMPALCIITIEYPSMSKYSRGIEANRRSIETKCVHIKNDIGS